MSGAFQRVGISIAAAVIRARMRNFVELGAELVRFECKGHDEQQNNSLY